MAPSLTLVARVSVRVDVPIAIGETEAGLRRIVSILGGTIDGPRLRGEILAAGADYQLIRPDGYTTMDARYAARLDDGAMIYIVNTAVRFGPPDVMARMTRGEPVDPAQVYFRSTPRFETDASAHRWITRPLFLASGIRHPDRVDLDIYEVG